jgi:hypothetical protein
MYVCILFSCINVTYYSLTLQRGVTGGARIAKTPYVVE